MYGSHNLAATKFVFEKKLTINNKKSVHDFLFVIFQKQLGEVFTCVCVTADQSFSDWCGDRSGP